MNKTVSKFIKNMSLSIMSACMIAVCGVSVSAYDVEHYDYYANYYSYTSPYYDVLVNLCGGEPFVGGYIGEDEYGNPEYGDGIMSIRFADMDSDSIKEMIVLTTKNHYYFDEYLGRYYKEYTAVTAYIYTICNGKAVCIYEDTDLQAVYAGLDTGAPVYGLSDTEGKIYFIKTEGNHEGGISLVNYILEKQGVSIQARAVLKAVSVMGLGNSYYNKGVPITESDYKAVSDKYLRYNGRMENTGSFDLVTPYTYGVSAYIAKELIPELNNGLIFADIKNGIF